MQFTKFCAFFCVAFMSANCFGQLVVGTSNTSLFSQTPPGGGAYTPLFQEDAEGLAWDGTQFHGSNGNGYWTAPLNGPATLVVNAQGVEEGFDPGGGAVQTITGLAYGNGTLFGSDASGGVTSTSPEGIYTIDQFGGTTLVFDFNAAGIAAATSIGGIAFNPFDGLLYGTNDDSDLRGLVAIDIANQSVTLVAPYDNDEDDIDGLAIGNGIAYLIDDDDDSPNGGTGLFYSYDLSQGNNGSYTQFAAPWTSDEIFSGATFITTPVPEPGGCAYAALLVAGMFMRRRKS